LPLLCPGFSYIPSPIVRESVSFLKSGHFYRARSGHFYCAITGPQFLIEKII
jgi:hypothetical protein